MAQKDGGLLFSRLTQPNPGSKHFIVPHLKKLDFVGGDFTLVVSLFQDKSCCKSCYCGNEIDSNDEIR